MKKNGRKINQSSCCIDNNCGALSILCHKEMNNVFFYYITKCIDMAYYDNGGTIPCLNTQKLLSEFVAIPYLERATRNRYLPRLQNRQHQPALPSGTLSNRKAEGI